MKQNEILNVCTFFRRLPAFQHFTTVIHQVASTAQVAAAIGFDYYKAVASTAAETMRKIVSATTASDFDELSHYSLSITSTGSRRCNLTLKSCASSGRTLGKIRQPRKPVAKRSKPADVIDKALARSNLDVPAKSETFLIADNFSEIADRAAAWLNIRPIGATPLGGDPVSDYDATTKRWVENYVSGGGGVGPTKNGVQNFGIGEKILWDSRAFIPAWAVPLDGQLLNRTDWPELWAHAQMHTPIDDADWLSSALNRGKWSNGDGSTTFRAPDLNGVQSGSIPGYLVGAIRVGYCQRAMYTKAPPLTFQVVRQRQALQDITNRLLRGDGACRTYSGSSFISEMGLAGSSGPTVTYFSELSFDASLSNPVYGRTANRMAYLFCGCLDNPRIRRVYGCYHVPVCVVYDRRRSSGAWIDVRHSEPFLVRIPRLQRSDSGLEYGHIRIMVIQPRWIYNAKYPYWSIHHESRNRPFWWVTGKRRTIYSRNASRPEPGKRRCRWKNVDKVAYWYIRIAIYCPQPRAVEPGAIGYQQAVLKRNIGASGYIWQGIQAGHKRCRPLLQWHNGKKVASGEVDIRYIGFSSDDIQGNFSGKVSVSVKEWQQCLKVYTKIKKTVAHQRQLRLDQERRHTALFIQRCQSDQTLTINTPLSSGSELIIIPTSPIEVIHVIDNQVIVPTAFYINSVTRNGNSGVIIRGLISGVILALRLSGLGIFWKYFQQVYTIQVFMLQTPQISPQYQTMLNY
ncbi:tail fiber protein [Vibrio phage Vc1]|uniref:Tail fiber protein n=1 Tax=Vibrio phage Vc1 TaxID=1480731 RepID=A0A9X9SEQ1_9CAUD|nr:tail fiber protein [Vibrio virus 2019VC1]